MATSPQRIEQRTDLIRRQFEDQIAHYTNERRSTSRARTVPFAADWLRNHQSASRICEFGGADGVLLQRIQEESGRSLQLVNAELVAAFRDKQVSGAIEFVETSILDPIFDASSFDVVIARNVLHHLIGQSLDDTQRNQQVAIEQLFRVTKPGGLIILEEMVNHSALATSILFALSMLNHRFLRFRIPQFEVTPNTVVAFMTPRRLLENVKTLGPTSTVVEFDPAQTSIYWKLTMLRRRTGILFVAAEKS